MVVNDRYRFVFVHVPKAAGSSIAASLRGLDGDQRRWVSKKTKHETLAEFQRRLPRRRGMGDRLKGRDAQGYLAIAFVRNPWARMFSLYRYMVRRGRPRGIATAETFADFLEQAAAGEPWVQRLHSMRQQTEFLTGVDGGGVDFLGRYEQLDDELARLEAQLGVTLERQHLNRSSSFGSDYREAYDDAGVELIERLFPDDVARLGYRFDRAEPVADAAEGLCRQPAPR